MRRECSNFQPHARRGVDLAADVFVLLLLGGLPVQVLLRRHARGREDGVHVGGSVSIEPAVSRAPTR